MKIVAVSGGVDSMFLLDLLKEEEIIVAHVNHGFREQSEEEYLMVKKYCEENKLKLEYKKLNLEKKDELTARNARYKYLFEICNKYNSTELYLGHHADDLSETFIMNVVKGATGKGLICMSEENKLENDIIAYRPLLNYSKEEIYKLAKEKNIPWMEDKTNEEDDVYKRNKIRLNVMPVLKELNPSINRGIKRITEENKEIEDYFDEIIKEEIKNINFVNGFYEIDKKTFNQKKQIIKKKLLKEFFKILGEKKVKHNYYEIFLEKTETIELNTDFQFLTANVVLLNTKDKVYLTDKNNYNSLKEGKGENLNKSTRKKIKNLGVPVAFRNLLQKEDGSYKDPLGNKYEVD